MEYCENECIRYGVRVPDILRSMMVIKSGCVKGTLGKLLYPIGIINKAAAEARFGNESTLPHESDERQKIITLEEKVAKLTDKVMVMQNLRGLNISDIYISSECRHGIILIF